MIWRGKGKSRRKEQEWSRGKRMRGKNGRKEEGGKKNERMRGRKGEEGGKGESRDHGRKKGLCLGQGKGAWALAPALLLASSWTWTSLLASLHSVSWFLSG